MTGFMDTWQFKKLQLSDISALKRYFELRPTLTCDSTIFDSCLWRGYYGAEYCVRDGQSLQWRSVSGNGQIFYSLPLCRAEDLPRYFDELRGHSHSCGGSKLYVYGADEESLDILDLDPGKWTVEEQTDFADYLYDAEKLRTLSGKAYHKKKNHLNAFLTACDGRWEYRQLGHSDRLAVKTFLARWEDQKDDDVGHHLQAEAQGLSDIYEYLPQLEAHMGGVFIDGQLEAFSIGTYNEARRMAIIHVEKANPEIRGLYAFINQQFLIREFPDAEFVNREDDMGLPGLRKAKESYHPVAMVKKYDILEK